jgi:hypothetical protein
MREHKKVIGSTIKTRLIFRPFTRILKRNCGMLSQSTQRKHLRQRDIKSTKTLSSGWEEFDCELEILIILSPRLNMKIKSHKEVRVLDHIDQGVIEQQLVQIKVRIKDKNSQTLI